MKEGRSKEGLDLPVDLMGDRPWNRLLVSINCLGQDQESRESGREEKHRLLEQSTSEWDRRRSWN
jgi:hypothetical protein